MPSGGNNNKRSHHSPTTTGATSSGNGSSTTCTSTQGTKKMKPNDTRVTTTATTPSGSSSNGHGSSTSSNSSLVRSKWRQNDTMVTPAAPTNQRSTKSLASRTKSTTTTNNNNTIADIVFNAPDSAFYVPEEVRSIKTTSVAPAHSSNEESSIPSTVMAHLNQMAILQPTNQNIKVAEEFPKAVSDDEKSSVLKVFFYHFFPEVKFINKETDLAWDYGSDSFCQFFISKCNVPLDVDKKEWWMRASKLIAGTLSQTRNDRNTAVKNAFIGKYIAQVQCDCAEYLTSYLIWCDNPLSLLQT